MERRGKAVLVTGGAVRLGRVIAERLAEEGLDVVIHYRSSADEAREVARRVGQQGCRAWLVGGDLAEPGVCARVIREATEASGGLAALINSASVFSKESLWTLDEADCERAWRVNCLAPILLTQAFARTAEAGQVVNLLDRRITSDDPECIPYLLSKKALAAFTRSAALALAPRFRVNGVAPGPILPPPGMDRKALHDRAGNVPLGVAACTPEAVAGGVLYLLRAEAVTGQVLFIDGGQHVLGNGVTAR